MANREPHRRFLSAWRPLSYIRDHWRGKLSLRTSLWINMLAALVVVSYTELFLLGQMMQNPARLVLVTLFSLALTRLIIYGWQLVGLIRAIEHDFLECGSILKTRALQGVALATLLFTMVYALEVIQGAIFYQHQVEVYARPNAQPDYTLEISENGQVLNISGGLDIGITTAVRSLLQINPQIESVTLQSWGGQIYEGRGLARLFIDYELDTYVYQECSSACTTAYIGGINRYIGPQGKLGFHQYWVDTSEHSRLVPFYNLRTEQDRDLALFEARGIHPDFLAQMFEQPANHIWFPDHARLRDARFVHDIVDTPPGEFL